MSSAAAAGIITGLLDFGSQIINNVERKNAAFDERLYNTPSNQVNRLLKAGINPYALAPQIAANNTSQAFPAGEVDLGGSSAKAVQAFSSAEQRFIQRELSSMQIQSMQEDITGKSLQNQYLRQTLDDRVSLQTLNVAKAQLDIQLKNGLITKQTYDNEIARLNTDFVKWKSGQWSETFGDPLDTYEDAPLKQEYDMEYTTKFHKMEKAGADSQLQQFELSIRNKMRPFIEQEIQYKGKISEAQYNYWFNHALREEIAYKYEITSNMPWASKQAWMHILEAVMSAAQQYQSSNPGAGIMESLWNGLKTYVGLKAKPHQFHKYNGAPYKNPTKFGRQPVILK